MYDTHILIIKDFNPNTGTWTIRNVYAVQASQIHHHMIRLLTKVIRSYSILLFIDAWTVKGTCTIIKSSGSLLVIWYWCVSVIMLLLWIISWRTMSLVCDICHKICDIPWNLTNKMQQTPTNCSHEQQHAICVMQRYSSPFVLDSFLSGW